MYRQIMLQDLDFQRIVLRASSFQPIQDYRFTRIAYGTALTLYLAISSLQQLDIDNARTLLVASKAALTDFYVDDLMSGANST